VDVIWFARAAIVSWATTGGVDMAVMAIASMMTALMPIGQRERSTLASWS
jgi:hypothetical protein